MIARTVMKEGHRDGEGISFEEFMSLTEGDAVTFEEYIKMVAYTGGNLGSVSKADYEKAVKAYSDVAQGISIPASPEKATAARTSSAAPAASSAAGAVASTAPQAAAQPALPPGVARAMCFNCKRAFGVPVGSQACACPHCGTVNNVITPQVQQHC